MLMIFCPRILHWPHHGTNTQPQGFAAADNEIRTFMDEAKWMKVEGGDPRELHNVGCSFRESIDCVHPF
jgi:hypothetical protein